MNLASPFWPQRSGVFRGFDAIVDATGGQYEGYNYFGLGGLLMIGAAIVLGRRQIRAMVLGHRYFCLVIAGATIFALSDRVFLFDTQLVDLFDLFRWSHSGPPAQTIQGPAQAAAPFNPLALHVLHLLAIFRSCGRMFWPVYYAALLFSLVIVLRRMPSGPAAAFVVVCCLLQLADSNPLRARMTTLTAHETPTLLDVAAWEARAHMAARVIVHPSLMCSGQPQRLPNMELQLAAVRARRPINSVYNPRLEEDCALEAEQGRNGPWQDDTLYVFLAGLPEGVADGWMPSGRSCHWFSHGIWCLGRTTPIEGTPSGFGAGRHGD